MNTLTGLTENNKYSSVPLFLLLSKFKISPLPKKAMKNILRRLEEVSVALHVLGVHDASDQSFLNGGRLTAMVAHRVTHIPQRLNNQHPGSANVLIFFSSSRSADVVFLTPQYVSSIVIGCGRLIWEIVLSNWYCIPMAGYVGKSVNPMLCTVGSGFFRCCCCSLINVSTQVGGVVSDQAVKLGLVGPAQGFS